MTIHSSFLTRLLAVAANRPDAVALASPGGQVRYGDLPGRIRSLAGRLAARGVGRGDLVGVLLPRCGDFVIGVAAVWWLGAAFLPLSLTWPARRRETILQEASPRLVLTQEAFLTHLPAGTRPLCLDQADVTAGIAMRAESPDDLAYVIYTSGSTGEPKGVAVRRRGLLPLFDAQMAAFELGPDCRCLWLLSPTFDASVSDVGTSLLSGATLFIEPDNLLADPPGLLATIDRLRITHADLPPSLLRVISPEDVPDCLRTVVVGGEPSPPEVLRRWAARLRVVNVYGPTEATVCSSLCVCHPDTWEEPLLGTPLPGVRYHVLDEHLRPAEKGELCIEGDCLARGYLGRPDLTAERFVELDGRRVYRTGDLVRRRSDGEYLFCGRLDRQFQLHGLRVEPGEIEAHLEGHPAVRRAAALLRRRGEEDLLVAFYAGAPSVTAAELREHLAARLPDWMIPALFLAVDDLPLSESGKVDFTALAQRPLPCLPQASEHLGDHPLAGLVAEVLGGSLPEWDVSFRDQGGDSFAVLRLVAAAAARGWTLSPSFLASAAPLRQALEVPPNSSTALSAAVLRGDVQAIIWNLPPGQRLPASREGGRIFLTGATGFFGSRLLSELLLKTPAEVVCLVRADSPAAARQRLRACLPGDVAMDRIDVVCGSLDEPRFGLPPRQWEALGLDVDTIFHSAAAVNLVDGYQALRSVNVLGTAEVLRLAATGRAKTLHYVSTLSVFVAADSPRGRFFESDALSQTGEVHGGYAQSKWAAEVLVRQAHDRAAQTRVYRPGLLTPDPEQPFSSSRDFLSLFIRGLARLGCLPPLDASALLMDITPIGFAARAVVALALGGGTSEQIQTYHVAGAGKLSLARLIDALRRHGVPIETVSARDWERRLEKLPGGDPGAAACLALCRAIPVENGYSRWRTMDLFQATGVEFDMRCTHAGLAGSGIVCPLPTDAVIDAYVGFALAQDHAGGLHQ